MHTVKQAVCKAILLPTFWFGYDNRVDGTPCDPVAAPRVQLAGGVRSLRAAVQRENTIYILDSRNHRVLVYDDKFHLLQQVGEIGQDPGGLLHPSDLAGCGKTHWSHSNGSY
jgi:hypothetical protein